MGEGLYDVSCSTQDVARGFGRVKLRVGRTMKSTEPRFQQDHLTLVY